MCKKKTNKDYLKEEAENNKSPFFSMWPGIHELKEGMRTI